MLPPSRFLFPSQAIKKHSGHSLSLYSVSEARIPGFKFQHNPWEGNVNFSPPHLYYLFSLVSEIDFSLRFNLAIWLLR